MKRYSSAASLVLAILAVLGLASPVPAGEQVPFVGRLEGVFTVTPVAPPLIVDVLVNATGNATHLGRFSLVMPHRVDRSTTPSTAIGTFQFTAANGDTVYGTFAGKGSPTPTPGVIAVVETMVITGGTGRFTGATGGFIAQRLVNQLTSRTSGAFSGTISSPGSSNP